MITATGITTENQIKTDLDLNTADLSAYKWTWIDFENPTTEEVQHLKDTFHFHPLAIEDCLQLLQRPKLDYYEGYTFYVTHHVHTEQKKIVKEELDFFVAENFIVTFHYASSKEVQYIRERLITQQNPEKWDPHYVFYQVLDKIVDNYFPLLHDVEDELIRIEDSTQNRRSPDQMPQLIDIRHLLLSLMQTVNLMRDVL